METLSYENFVLEAKKLAESKKRRPYVRILNLLALILGLALLPICLNLLENLSPTKADAKFFLFFIIIGYITAIYLINVCLSIPVKISPEEINISIKKTFEKKAEYYQSEYTVSESKIEYYEDRLLEAKADAGIAHKNLMKFQKIQSNCNFSLQ